jgi:dihydroorotase
MPRVGEEIMIARDIRLAEYTGGQYHAAHVSVAETLDHIRNAKAKGLHVTCEVTPHHFTLTDEALSTFDTNTKMNPPLRTREDVEAMKSGLQEGVIDVIATDHAPHSYDEKEVEFAQAPFGIIGLETAVGLAVTELVRKNVLSLYQLVEKLSTNPRQLLHLSPVAVAEGEQANLTLFDPAAEWIVDPPSFKSRARNTPFGGVRLVGKPVGILNNGLVYWC